MAEAGKVQRKFHPEDAVPIYQRTIEPTLNRKDINSYREAVRTLRVIQRLMKELGRDAHFIAYLEGVRIAHRPKRNFMKLLDQVPWH